MAAAEEVLGFNWRNIVAENDAGVFVLKQA